MQPVYQNPNQPTTEGVYRTNTIMWAAMLISQFMFFVVIYFAKPQVFEFIGANNGEIVRDEPVSYFPIFIVLAVVAVIVFALSFVIKSRLLKYAIDSKNVELVQQAQIVAYALCEAVSLFGMVVAFTVNSRFFFLWFVVGILGMLLHFPRREHFHAAAFTGIK